MNLEGYPTPLTDDVDLMDSRLEGYHDSHKYDRMHSLAKRLERKLAMCRLALDDAQYAVLMRRNTGLPTYDEIANATEKRIRETLKATEPTP